MASGTILIQTCTSDASLPVENATIAIFEPGPQGRQNLLAVRRTDSSGKAGPVELETPDDSESQEPEMLGILPYRVVDLVADHPDFEQVTVDGVQVFDGIVTFQKIVMVPRGMPMPGEEPGEVIDIPGQEL